MMDLTKYKGEDMNVKFSLLFFPKNSLPSSDGRIKKRRRSLSSRVVHEENHYLYEFAGEF